MPLVSMHELTTFRWSLEEDLLRYREAGYDGVGVWLRKAEEFGDLKAIELLDECDLAVSNVGWVGGFTGDSYLTRDDNLDEARRAIDFAAQVNARCLVVHSGGRNGHTRGHARRLFREALDELLPHAEQAGVTLVLEPMHPATGADWTLIHDLADGLRWVNSYDCPELGLAYDAFQFSPEEAEFRPEELVARLAVVHLGSPAGVRGVDQAREPLRGDDARLARVIAELTAAGYDGYYDVKLLGPSIEPRSYQRIVDDSQRIVRHWAAAPVLG